uniref:Uncharacterized protein n=1 Tax=viral metagenome TaxID=1070528 RepID=A0A6C0KSI9_9ZZZZ
MALFNILAKKTKKLRNIGTRKFKALRKRFLTRKVPSLSPRTKLVTQIQRTYRKKLKSREALKKKLKDAQKWAERETAEIERASAIVAFNKEQLKNRTALDGSSVRMTRGHKQKLEQEIRDAQWVINSHNRYNYRAQARELEQQLNRK